MHVAFQLAPENRAVVQHLTQLFSIAKQYGGVGKPCCWQIDEFEDCRYLLSCKKEQPDVLRLAFAAAYPIANEGLQRVRDTYAGIADVSRDEHQVILKISLSHLCRLETAELQLVLKELARVRLHAVGGPLRQLLTSMTSGNSAAASCTIHSRPNAPFFAAAAEGSTTVLFPMWTREGSADLLTMAFVQEFAEARRSGGLSDAPQCFVTFPGQVPPVKLDADQREALEGFKGGFLTIVVFPCHICNRAKLEELVWSMLTFYSYLAFHVRSFKAFVHAKIRKNADDLLTAMEAAQANPKKNRKLTKAPHTVSTAMAT